MTKAIIRQAALLALGAIACAASPARAQSLGIAISSPIDHGRGSVSLGLSAPLVYNQGYAPRSYQPAYAPIRPAPLIESIPYLPRGYVWIQGYWRLDDDNAYRWIPGYAREDVSYGYAPTPSYNSYYGSAPTIVFGLGNSGWGRGDRWDRDQWRPSPHFNRPHFGGPDRFNHGQRPDRDHGWPRGNGGPGRPGGNDGHGRPGGGDQGRPSR